MGLANENGEDHAQNNKNDAKGLRCARAKELERRGQTSCRFGFLQKLISQIFAHVQGTPVSMCSGQVDSKDKSKTITKPADGANSNQVWN